MTKPDLLTMKPVPAVRCTANTPGGAATALAVGGAALRETESTAALSKGGPLVSAPDLLVSGSHRDKAGQVEVHDKETDVIYVVDGAATITSTGTQTYAGAVTLLTGTTLTASTVTFQTSTATITGGVHNLTIDGVAGAPGGAVFDGTVASVNNLTVNGSTTIDTASIASTGTWVES